MQRFSPLLVLCIAAFFLMIGVGMIVSLLPQKVFAATGSLESVGLIASVFALAYFVAQLPVGMLADRFGAKRLLVAGYTLCGLAGLVFLAAQDAGAVFAGRLIQGIGEAPIWALGPAALSVAYSHQKGRVIGIYNATIHAGLTVGPLATLVIAADARATVPFALFAGLCLAAAVFLAVFLRRAQPVPSSTTASNPLASLKTALATRSAGTVLAGVFLYGAGYGVFISVLPVTMTLNNGFNPSTVAILFTLFYAGISLSQIVAGPLSDRIGRWRVMIAGMAAAALGFALLPFVPGLIAFGPLAFASLGLGVYCVASIAALADAVPDHARGTVSGAYYLFWGFGYFAGPMAVGALAADWSVYAYLALSAAMAAQVAVSAVVRSQR
ncbi:MAG: MFS transporter [Hyphomicrobiales bacterium]|nr:MAG: MFS transporter [Hyphomicrobiales bacterium]